MKNFYILIFTVFSMLLFSCNNQSQTEKTSKLSNHPPIKGSMLVEEKGCINCHDGKKAKTFKDIAKSAPSDEETFKEMVKGKCMTDNLSENEFNSFAEYITKQLKN